MKKNFLIKIWKTDLSVRVKNAPGSEKVVYLFELILILMRDTSIKYRNFGKKSLAELNTFIDEKFSQEEKTWFWMKVQEILNLKVTEVKVLLNSKEFKALIKKLKNPNLDWEQASDFNKKFIYQKLTKVMVNKLVKLAEVLPNKTLGYFFQPNEKISLDIEVERKLSVERYNLPIEDFQERIKKFLIKQLIYEIKKPD